MKAGRPTRTATLADLLRAAARADVVLVGDDHALPRAQRNLALLAQRLLGRGLRPALALEAFERRHQALLDAFLDRRLDEGALLRRAGLRRRWPFDLRGLLRVLRLARRRRLPVHALDGLSARRADRSRRERRLARGIADAVARGGRLPVVALVGETHLPSLRRRLRPFRTLTLSQVPLSAPGAPRSRSRARVAQTGGERFVLLDESAEVARILHDARLASPSDLLDRLAGLATGLARWIGVPAPRFDAVEVLPAGSNGDTRFPVEVAPARRRILLRNDHPHHQAEAAAHLLRLSMGPRRPAGPFERYAEQVLSSAFAFACSRSLNPHRAPLAPSRWVEPRDRAPLERLLEAQRRWLREADGPAARRRFLRALGAAGSGSRNAAAASLGQVLGVRLHRDLASGWLDPSGLAAFLAPGRAAGLYHSLHAILRGRGRRAARRR